MREEGHYTLKKVDKLPKKGNANFLYYLEEGNSIPKVYKWFYGKYIEYAVGKGEVRNIYYGTSPTPPDVNTVEEGSIYIYNTKRNGTICKTNK